MKKRAISSLLVLALLVSGIWASAVEISPMWSYLSTVIRTLDTDGSDLEWGTVASAYAVQGVTSVKVSVQLQRYGTSWVMVASDTETESGNIGYAGGTYTNWTSGQRYRMVTNVTIYGGTTVLEQVGPLYDYLNT